ncbi:hypothetical protein QE410_002180 [Microbacterium sp. SORGH_AS 1204]|nr:hypothetical protein [Microbacterium sp. SORGH_AS_1204]
MTRRRAGRSSGGFEDSAVSFSGDVEVADGAVESVVATGRATWAPNASTGQGDAPQYQPVCSEWLHAPHGLPYRESMYDRPQEIWVAPLVRQSSPADAIFSPGSA